MLLLIRYQSFFISSSCVSFTLDWRSVISHSPHDDDLAAYSKDDEKTDDVRPEHVTPGVLPKLVLYMLHPLLPIVSCFTSVFDE